MKKQRILLFAILLFFLVLLGIANADIIVDTGVPTGCGEFGCGSLEVSERQYLAVEFVLNHTYLINDVVGYMRRHPTEGGFELSIVIYSDDGDIPGIELFSQSFLIQDSGDPPTYNWEGATGLNWLLNPGSYWVSFEVRVGQTFNGGMKRGAPNPIADGAFFFLPNDEWRPSPTIDVGIRIQGTRVPINIDIMPRNCPNGCTIKGGGSIEVAILGSVDFDVTNIDVASVRLEGVAPVRSSLKDKSIPVVPPPTDCECTTEGRDGFLDLCLKFDKKEILSALGGVNVGDSLVLTLTGTLNDGIPIEGQDCIVIVKKGKKD